jgi:hypothetical protein
MIDAQVKAAMKLVIYRFGRQDTLQTPSSRVEYQAFASIVKSGTHICTGTLINPTVTSLVLTINRRRCYTT